METKRDIAISLVDELLYRILYATKNNGAPSPISVALVDAMLDATEERIINSIQTASSIRNIIKNLDTINKVSVEDKIFIF